MITGSSSWDPQEVSQLYGTKGSTDRFQNLWIGMLYRQADFDIRSDNRLSLIVDWCIGISIHLQLCKFLVIDKEYFIFTAFALQASGTGPIIRG